MSLAFAFALVAVFGQFRFEPRTPYQAVFTNISGMKSGNFVRIAGVEVGKVTGLHLHRDGTVTVNFSIDRSLPLTEGTRAAVRYRNLVGDRYLSLEDGPGSVRRMAPGETIPLARHWVGDGGNANRLQGRDVEGGDVLRQGDPLEVRVGLEGRGPVVPVQVVRAGPDADR